MRITKEVLDKFLKVVERPEDLLGDAGLMRSRGSGSWNGCWEAELTAHLGYA